MTLKLLDVILRSPEGEGGAEPPTPAMEEMRDVMAFDPFAPPAKSGAGGGEGEEGREEPVVGATGEDPPPVAGAAEAAPKPAPAPSPSPQPGPAKKEGEDDPLAELRATVQRFLTKKPEPPPAAVPQPQAKQPAETKPGETPEKARYNISVPDPVIEAISAEEPERRRQGVNALVNGIMNKIVEDFSGALVDLEKRLRQEVPSQVMEHVGAQQTVARIKSDFYEAWPDLKRVADALPGMDETIWSTIVNAGKNAGVNEWTPEFRDQIGQMLHLQLNIPVPQGKPAAAKAAAPEKPAPRAVFSAGSGAGGSRPNGAAADNEFLDVLGAGQG